MTNSPHKDLSRAFSRVVNDVSFVVAGARATEAAARAQSSGNMRARDAEAAARDAHRPRARAASARQSDPGA